jgi:hypothetical protein
MPELGGTLRWSTTPDLRDLSHQVRIGAKCLGRRLFGVNTKPVDGRANQHHARYADDNPQ